MMNCDVKKFECLACSLRYKSNKACGKHWRKEHKDTEGPFPGGVVVMVSAAEIARGTVGNLQPLVFKQTDNKSMVGDLNLFHLGFDDFKECRITPDGNIALVDALQVRTGCFMGVACDIVSTDPVVVGSRQLDPHQFSCARQVLHLIISIAFVFRCLLGVLRVLRVTLCHCIQSELKCYAWIHINFLVPDKSQPVL